VVISGTPIKRPRGQIKAPTDEKPKFSASNKLDMEIEVAFFVGGSKDLGDSITMAEVDNHMFGMVLCNDWSARDIQAWEYVPLGPFLAKNFGTSISAWVTPFEALDAYKVQLTHDYDRPILDYLKDEQRVS